MKPATKIFVWFVLFILFLANSRSAVQDEYTLFYNMTFEDGYPGFTGNSSNDWIIDGTLKKGGANGLRVDLELGGEDYLYINNATFNFNTTTRIVIRGWFKDDGGTVDKPLLMFPFSNSNLWEATGCMYSGNGYTINYLWDGSSNYDQTEHGAFTDNWFFAEINITNSTVNWGCYEDQGMTVYENQLDTATLFATKGYLGFYCYDDCAFDDIEIWTFGTGGGAGGGTTPSFNLATNLSSNINQTENPYTFYVSGNTFVNVSSTIFNCSVYLNDTLNITALDIDINNTNNIFNLTYGSEEVGNNINVTCNRLEQGYYLEESLSYTDVFLDSVFPELQITSTFVNNSIFFRNIDTLDFNVTTTDTNLYAVNLSIHHYNSDVSYNRTNNNTFVENINSTSWTVVYSGNYSQNFANVANWSAGFYKIEVQAWDSHTNNNVRPISWFEQDSAIEVGNILLEGDIKPELTDFYLSKDGTRHKFKITWNDDSLIHYLNISAKGDLDFIPGSDYKGHFVCFEVCDQRWIDFQGSNIKDVAVKNLGNKYNLQIELYSASDEVEFESIGDLNYRNSYFNFNLSESFKIEAKDVFTNVSVGNFTITVWNGTNLVNNKTTTGTTLYFNITGNYTTNFTGSSHADNSTGNISFYPGGNFTYNVFASNSLYLFIYDEQTNTLITSPNVTIQIINYDNSSTEVTTGTGSTFYSGLSPGLYELRYKATGFNTRSYYTTITDSSTQSIDLYLLNSSHATYTTFINEDETGNRYEGAYFKAYRHFTDCNCFKIVEMDLTNFNGISVVSLEHYEGKYKFIVEYNNATVYSSTATEGYKITQSSYSIVWTLFGDTTESWFGTSGLYQNLSFDNSTKYFWLTVNDPSSLVDQFCLYVDEMNSLSDYGSTEICSNCLNASSGAVSCNVSAYIANGRQLVAKGWIHTSTEYSEYWLNPISWFTDLSAVESLGVLGVFMGFIIILTTFFAGLVVAGLPGAVIFFDVALIAVSALNLIMVGLPILIGVIAISVIVLILIGDR